MPLQLNLNMSKEFKDNYLTKENGCKVISATSEREGSPASNILNSNQKIWMIEESLPQHCIINTRSLKSYPKVFNRVAFYCWHQYETNPALIELAYNHKNHEEWIVVAKIRLQLKSQKQYFKIKDIPSTEMEQLKITILENFGDVKTYLNQVELGFVKEDSTIEPIREKTFSDFMKLTSTEKELKRAQEQIKRLTNENQQIKQTVRKQGETIIEMQMAFKTLTKEMEKLQKIQQLQVQKYMSEQKGVRKEIKNVDLKKNQIHFNTNSSGSESEGKREQRRYIEDKIMNKKTLSKKNTSQSYAKSNHNSNKRQRQLEDVRISKGTTIRQSKNKIRDTQSDLSQYSVSGREDKANTSKYSQKCSEMMLKLQILLAQRQRRQKQLKKKSERSNS